MQVAPHPVTVTIIQGWNWTDVASLALTAVLVAIAALEIRRAKRAEAETLAVRKARERAADFRVSAEAYNAQQRLAPLLAAFPREMQPPEAKGLAQASWASEVATNEELTQNINTLGLLAAESSDRVFGEVDNAYKKYRKATEEARGCRSAWENIDRDLSVVDAQAKAVQIYLADCAASLASIIDPVLLAQTLRMGSARF